MFDYFKHSSSIAPFHIRITEMVENGELDVIWKRWEPQKSSTCGKGETPSLGMPTMITLFFLLITFAVLAMIVIFLEFIVRKKPGTILHYLKPLLKKQDFSKY